LSSHAPFCVDSRSPVLLHRRQASAPAR
jgi:hypothetical protein